MKAAIKGIQITINKLSMLKTEDDIPIVNYLGVNKYYTEKLSFT
jgi:hypothetical protein